MTGESNSLLETIRLIETIESAIPCGEQGDRIDVNRRLIATEVAVALLPYLDAQFAAGAEAMRDEAAQRCRYVLKHNEHTFEADDAQYASGFEVACKVCEVVIGHLPTSRDGIRALHRALPIPARGDGENADG